ncbi:MAG: 4-hydroxythreonine-4-phosphate dehydrogenase PdxA [Candidatus Omnitrophica bacterium]|nr:4-hydroxythreonine-4-phosphate dehydrogenase PdxA [Candidatus Omnitrophota bacterium]MCM8809510.1 4-hydroxythreonine-4-phosphate dehydrogenase PdxA [Candidatus Omnitrophota bacterium]MCM8833663.1 4-hydroxythreonine-4-phosphate dehydrogenase PdxA [Candidatus Omnitrophota bacterium]
MKKIIGITIGDPAGIGPEILLKGYKKITKFKDFIPLIIGDISVIEKNIEILDLNLNIKKIKRKEEIDENFMNVYNINFIKNKNFPVGIDNEISGKASFKYVIEGIELWKRKIIDGLVTLPISKKAWNLAGYNYSGHTELLAERLKEKKYAMVMIAGNYKVLLLTTHIPLKDVFKYLNEKLIIEKAIIGYKFLKKIKIKKPKIGICGINPHSGEEGVIGKEEIEIIKPALEKIKRKGIDIEGPFPADTIFRKNFDLIISIYHDQALIPLKTFYFEKLVNFTAGIKLPRASPGHGTAFDIAYKNKANPESFICAYDFILKILK